MEFRMVSVCKNNFWRDIQVYWDCCVEVHLVNSSINLQLLSVEKNVFALKIENCNISIILEKAKHCFLQTKVKKGEAVWVKQIQYYCNNLYFAGILDATTTLTC